MPNRSIEELRKKLIGKAKRQVQEKYSGKESHVIRAVGALQDLDACFNLLAEHCIEWYGSHFPELQNIAKDNQGILKLIYFVGEKSKFTEKNVEENAGKENAKRISEAARKSMGSSIEENSLKEIQLLALNALNLKEERDFLLKFVEGEMNSIAPNFSIIAGPLLAARLLAEAGSLKGLAIMPSSTIQLLGAEKALFRHFKNKQAKPPKHGLIFMHAMLQKTPKDHKGKMARALAGKLSIAARADYFGKRNIAAELQAGLQKRFDEIKTRGGRNVVPKKAADT